MEGGSEEPVRPAVRINDAERERAAEVLQRACGEGRLTLDEFTARVGAVWAADSAAELARLTEGLPALGVVGQGQPVTEVASLLGTHKRYGPWRVPRRLRLSARLGTVKLDFREATIDPETLADGVLDIDAQVVLGTIKITVPEGVEVEMAGSTTLGSRQVDLAPVPRRPGTPVIRLNARVTLGTIKVWSARSGMPDWIQKLVRKVTSH